MLQSEKQKQLLRLKADTLRIEAALRSIQGSTDALQQLLDSGQISKAIVDQLTEQKIEPLLDALKVNQRKMAALLLELSQVDDSSRVN
ncbi:MAG: hypothetical protein CMH98_00090 [Oceanospirillaceae bacterium]|nr:hypothetical protein [Oceanospirillaceae bacterium]